MRLAQLEIPLSPEFVSLVRLVVSSVADDRYELTDEQLDNLKLAVSEACVMALGSSEEEHREGTISVTCDGAVSRLDVSVQANVSGANGHAAFESSSALGNGLGLPFIGSLVDSVEVKGTDDTQYVRLSINCEQAELL